MYEAINLTGIEKYFEDVEIQRKTVSGRDKYNAPLYTWGHYATIQGRIRQLSGSEPLRNDQFQKSATHRLYCYPPDDLSLLKPDDESCLEDRIVFGLERLAIVAINDVMNFGNLLQVDLELIKGEN